MKAFRISEFVSGSPLKTVFGYPTGKLDSDNLWCSYSGQWGKFLQLLQLFFTASNSFLNTQDIYNSMF